MAAPTPLDILDILWRRRWLLLLGPLAAGVLALGLSFLIPPTFTARTTFLPPQQSSSANAALAALGPLAGLAGGSGLVRTPSDQFVALLESMTVAERIIDQFDLVKVYGAKLRTEARETLGHRMRASVGKKDGLIAVEVDDRDPARAARMANAFVEELRRMTSRLAVTEAQQRRAFFDAQLKQARDALTRAQQALVGSGYNQGVLKAEPRAAAESYARLQAEVTATEVRLQALRGTLADTAPEVQQLLAALSTLRARLARAEQPGANQQESADYITRYREFKYQEALFELYSRQFELARVDESREGAMVQVVDTAVAPEKRSAPRRSFIALVTTVLAGVLLTMGVLLRAAWSQRQRQRLAPA